MPADAKDNEPALVGDPAELRGEHAQAIVEWRVERATSRISRDGTLAGTRTATASTLSTSNRSAKT